MIVEVLDNRGLLLAIASAFEWIGVAMVTTSLEFVTLHSTNQRGARVLNCPWIKQYCLGLLRGHLLVHIDMILWRVNTVEEAGTIVPPALLILARPALSNQVTQVTTFGFIKQTSGLIVFIDW